MQFVVLWEESLNSDGQQFHRYQQNNLSTQIIEHKKDYITNDAENPGPSVGQTQRCVGVKPVNGMILVCKLTN